MHYQPQQQEAKPCAYCTRLFIPRRRWEAFCSPKCRTAYDVDIGTQGTVVSVRRINRGASIVVHLTGPAAERALNLEIKQTIRLVKATT